MRHLRRRSSGRPSCSWWTHSQQGSCQQA
uniref:Uncharacterized protein n=1 Tax=Arundo donax TaxID=35708 RepID=A0A0A9EYC3_ARUDO